MDATEDPDSNSNEKKSLGACSSCHRRKLKCDRMPICSNCRKADIPCVYSSHPIKPGSASTTRDGRKKVRGPYQKGRTVREKELEHVVEILQEKCTILEARVNSSEKTSPESSHSSAVRSPPRFGSTPARIDENAQPIITFNSPLNHDPTSTKTETSLTDTTHPPLAQIFELWLIYTTTVDPVTKIIHCPTFTPTLLNTLKCHPTMQNLLTETEALLLAIYITSLNALEPEEVYQRFNHSQETLMTHYSTLLEQLLLKASSTGTLTFATLQALVVYMACLRRQKGPGDNIAIFFNLALRTARSLKLDDGTTYPTLPPLDSELRRRVWWNICRHESAYAEEIQTRKQSIMHDTEVPLPGNFDDQDLDANMTISEMPAARVGVTGMSVVLMMLEVVRMVGKLSALFNRGDVDVTHVCGSAPSVRSNCLKEQSRRLFEETRARTDMRVLQYCSVSRPLDWFLMIVTKMLFTKVEVMLLNYSPDANPTAINAFHDMKVGLSLDVIECHQILLQEPKLEPWRWLYRNKQQWYSMIYVLEEMARRPDAPFVDRAWKVVEVVFADMDLLNKHGMKAGDRTRLLEGHGRAIEARGKVLRWRGVVVTDADAAQDVTLGNGGFVGGVGDVSDYPLPVRSEPWQIDQSLFDVQEAQLASMEDVFFWPST